MTDIAVIEVWAAPREDMTQGREMTECENKTDLGGDWHQREERPIKKKKKKAVSSSKEHLTCLWRHSPTSF